MKLPGYTNTVVSFAGTYMYLLACKYVHIAETYLYIKYAGMNNNVQ